MKTSHKSLFILIGLLVFAISCTQRVANILQKYNTIEEGMHMDEIVSIMGGPQNIQFSEGMEIWQYCRSSIACHNFYTISFRNKLVSNKSNYIKADNDTRNKTCDQCFKDMTLANNRVSANSNSRKSDKRGKNYILKDGEWVRLSSAESTMMDSVKSERKPRSEKKSRLSPSILEDTMTTEEDLFIVNLEQTKLVKIIAQFNAGSSVPLLIDSSELVILVEKVNMSTPDKYVLIGHTNSQGNALSNLKLSKERATATHEILERDFGLDASKLKSGGAGEELPVSDDSTSEGRRENSRVELRMYNKK